MKVFILRGIPGSGKSTYAKKLVEEHSKLVGGVILSADDFFTHNGDYKFDPSRIGEAHQTCFAKYVYALPVGYNAPWDVLVVDNTNIHAWEIAPYVLACESFSSARPMIDDVRGRRADRRWGGGRGSRREFTSRDATKRGLSWGDKTGDAEMRA